MLFRSFHSVIETPDSVRRVMPPTTTMARTMKATMNSQRDSAVASFRSLGVTLVLMGLPLLLHLPIRKRHCGTGEWRLFQMNLQRALAG